MRRALLMLILLPVIALADLPFLFTPHARGINKSGTGYTVDLDGDRLTVSREGNGWKLAAGGLHVASYRNAAGSWVEMPGGRTWRQDASGRWRVSNGWTLAKIGNGWRLSHPGGTTAWRPEGSHGWVRVAR